ncbi:MAG: hypothetical protein JSV77_02920 [Dehalococcoidales bacterium]|nr:MAG: hypothetical protein JSV77_02920 [Dehalococcoidales bacterium]
MGRYLCITGASRVGSGAESGRRAIRVPLALIRAGYKLHSLIPERATGLTKGLREHGIGPELRNLKQEDLEHLLEAPDALEIAIVRGGRERVRIYIE